MELPVPFEESMRQLLGDEYDAFRTSLLGEPAVSIRLNRSKCTVQPDYEPVPWATDGYYLPAVSCRMLLRTGSFIDVRRASHTPASR